MSELGKKRREKMSSRENSRRKDVGNSIMGSFLGTSCRWSLGLQAAAIQAALWSPQSQLLEGEATHVAEMSQSQMTQGSEMMALCQPWNQGYGEGQVHYCEQKPSQSMQEIHGSAVISSRHMLRLGQAQLDIPTKAAPTAEPAACLTCECERCLWLCLAPEGI